MILNFPLIRKTQAEVQEIIDELNQQDYSIYHSLKQIGIEATAKDIFAEFPKDFLEKGAFPDEVLMELLAASLGYINYLEDEGKINPQKHSDKLIVRQLLEGPFIGFLKRLSDKDDIREFLIEPVKQVLTSSVDTVRFSFA